MTWVWAIGTVGAAIAFYAGAMIGVVIGSRPREHRISNAARAFVEQFLLTGIEHGSCTLTLDLLVTEVLRDRADEKAGKL